MRIKWLMTVVLTGLLSLHANAGFEQFNPVNGSMNVLSLGGVYEFSIVPFGLPELKSVTTNDRTFVLSPNENLYADNPGDATWRNNGGAGPDGAKIVEAYTLWEMGPFGGIELTADIDTVGFDFTVDAFDLDTARYELRGVAKVLKSSDGTFAELTKQDLIITGASGVTNQFLIGTGGFAGELLQVGWFMRGVNANPATNYGSATVTATDLYATSSDFNPPTPNPTFASPPTAISDTAITMTATTATDDFYGVEYMFTNITAGTSSGWQNSTNYTETGLSGGTTYSYKVIARDTGINANETALSAASSATTATDDLTAPTPTTMAFSSTDVGTSMIKLTATPAADPSGVEYYFASTAGGGNDSGWQDSPVYYDTGLVPGSSYSYTVIARDKSAAMNSNNVSTAANLATLSVDSGAFNNALTGFTGNTDDMDVVLELNKIGLETGSEDPDALIAFGAGGATFGDLTASPIYESRDVLRTIASEYGGVSFEAYATLTFAGNSDLSGFLGIGQGLQIGVSPNFGVPELNLGGVNGVCAQFKDSTAGSGTLKCNLFKFVSGNPGGLEGQEILSNPVGSTETIRARLIYDAVAETVNVAFDKNYIGGAFVADQDMGTVSTALSDTTSMWLGAPVRVYVGGGEGTIVKDFEIVVTRAAQPAFDVQVADTVPGGGLVFTWDGVFGATYDVQYTTNLVTGPWVYDPSPGASNIFSAAGGSVSATSTVDSAAVFYRTISR